MKKFFIGIDFSKKTFDVTLLEKGKLDEKGMHHKFQNSSDGFTKFKEWMEKHVGPKCREEILLCGENTGTCSKLVSDLLARDGFSMWLESALRIKLSMGIRRGKDDKKDSHDIAVYASRFSDMYKSYEPMGEALEALQTLFSKRRLIVQQMSSLKSSMKELQDCESIKELLGASVECEVQTIEFLGKMKKSIEEQMLTVIRGDEKMSHHYDILTSMKGISLINASAIIIYTRDFTRFEYDARRICSYWGVAPFRKQSGTSLDTTPHVSQYADHFLKSLLSEAALCAMIHCPSIRAYTERLRAKGKHESIVKNNCKNKMLHILVSMVKNDTFYEEGHENKIKPRKTA